MVILFLIVFIKTGSSRIIICASKIAARLSPSLSIARSKIFLNSFFDCAKSLLNGACKDTKNGKCEVKINGKERDCAWEKIYNKLNNTNRVLNFLDAPVQLRDFSKPDFLSINKYKNLNREKRAQNFYGGVYHYEKKESTEDIPITQFPEPEIVVVPLSQHTGTPCKPTVVVGERVKVGQKIGIESGFISSNIHSSVSGKVIAIEERTHPVIQKKILSVVIENE